MAPTQKNVAVVGIGAMGGGMARAMRDAGYSVSAYDQSDSLLSAFYNEQSMPLPTDLHETVTGTTDAVFLVLVNQAQCEDVLFGSTSEGTPPLCDVLAPNTMVVVCSTVTAAWIQSARDRLLTKKIVVVDCPTSGGPVRARNGELTLMVATDTPEHAARMQPYLDVLGSDVHTIAGGVGMGSTVKMVHQLLAGVHICVAAEALALAATAGLDVEQLYAIVNGAAGASWMFQDRGSRMIGGSADEVKSRLDIFVKDLDIVFSEAKRLQSPIPVASAALQQFISGQALGLGKKDDSRVVQVYENVTGKSVKPVAQAKGETIEDVWVMEDGTREAIVEVAMEPRHKLVLQNEYTRVLRVSFPPNDTTLAHRHAEDSLYFFLVETGLDVINHVKGQNPACDCMEFGEVRYGTHKTDQPLIHKITNKSETTMLCVDAEVLRQPPITAAIPLVAEKHELIKTREKCRVYKLTLEPGESVAVGYPFFHLTVVVDPSTIELESGSKLRWVEERARGDVAWKEPSMECRKTNKGTCNYVEYISEWR